MVSYEKILARMQEKYTELSGCAADDASDAGIKLKVLAGEVCSLLTELDWLKMQSFPQTATGDELALRALERGISRKEATVAVGEIEFSRPAVFWANIEIPLGTVCATSGDNPVRFVTTESVMLMHNATSVAAKARAESAGRNGNAAPGKISVLVLGPGTEGGIKTLKNLAAFTGGADAESDTVLRGRLLQSLRGCPNGTNTQFYREVALSEPEVSSVSIKCRINGSGTVGIYLAGRGKTVPEETVKRIKEKLEAMREVNVALTVEPVKTHTINIRSSLTLAPGKSFAAAKAACETAAANFFDELSAGQNFFTAQLSAAMVQTGYISTCWIDETQAGDYATPVDTLVVCGTITFTHAVMT